jgi:hypothetical protein
MEFKVWAGSVKRHWIFNRAIMADDIYDSAALQPSMADFKKFWYEPKILNRFLKLSDCFLEMTGF